MESLVYAVQVALWLAAGAAAGLGLGEGIGRLRMRRASSPPRDRQ